MSDAERGLADKKPKERRFIMGKTLGIGKKPILPLRVPKAAKGRLSFTKKWWVPHYMFSGSQYPSMVSGSGYLMDYDSARCIFGEVMKLPYFHLEVSPLDRETFILELYQFRFLNRLRSDSLAVFSPTELEPELELFSDSQFKISLTGRKKLCNSPFLILRN